jgi:hypothetical protein
MKMYEAESQTTPAEARKDDGLSYKAYRAARERFFARLRADSEVRRLEALWKTATTRRTMRGRRGGYAREATN